MVKVVKDDTRIARIRKGERRKRNWKTFGMQINAYRYFIAT